MSNTASISPFSFTQQHVLVVGGTSGINLGVAMLFAEMGASVTVCSRQSQKVDAAVAKLQAHAAIHAASSAATIAGFCADVRELDVLAQGIEEAVNRAGPLQVVVSGAAGNFPALVADMSSNGFRSVMEIDLLGTFHVMKAVYPHLVKPGAAVINISAPQAFIPMEGQSHVCAAKAGVDMLTRTLCKEWGEDGVRINSIVPGPIAGTEGMNRLAPGEKMQQAVAKTVPLQRLGDTRDIGMACAFLASPWASYISGAILPVDGGWSQNAAGNLSGQLAAALKQSQ